METKIPKPAIWKTFERTTKEGKVKKFWTQNLPEEHKELAMNYLLNHFMREEPLCRALKMRETVDSSNELCEIWRNILPQNCTLACYTVDDDMKEKLVGLNICSRNSQSDDKINYQDKTERTKKLLGLLDDISNKTELYQRFGVDEYLGAMGLFTLPEYRGYNIGFELLDSRRYLCQTLGIRLSVTIFTGPASQRLAEKAGFRDVYPVSLDDIEARYSLRYSSSDITYSSADFELIPKQMNNQNPTTGIWKTFERRTTREGNVKTFWIQNLPEEYEKLAMNNFLEYFLKDEPFSRALNIRESEVAVEELRNIWMKFVNQKCSLACFTKDDDMTDKLVAFNFCRRKSVFHDLEETDYEGLSERSTKFLGFCDYIMHLEDLYDKFNVNEYLDAMDLFVLPEYRSYDIALEILQSRKYLCHALGLNLTVTILTNPSAQRAAENAGFKDVLPISLDKFEEHDSTLAIPNLRYFTETIRLMYMLYDS